MLVLSRKVAEVIHIGENIEIVVVQISGNRVKLAISAPLEIPVLRGELVPVVSKASLIARPVNQNAENHTVLAI
jgi:carbon storage regulator